jgi:hypothetical protein
MSEQAPTKERDSLGRFLIKWGVILLCFSLLSMVGQCSFSVTIGKPQVEKPNV